MALSDKYNFEPLNPLQWGKQMPTVPGAMAPDPTWAGGLLGAGYRHPHAVTPLLYSTGARAIPTATKFAAQGAKEIWQSPIGDAVKRYGWDALSQGLGWWGTNRLREFAGDLEEGKYDTEPGTIPIGGDPLRQDTTPPLFGYDSVGSARIAERKSLDEAGFSSKSIQAARNLEDREYTAQELMKIFYPTSRKGNPKPSPFSAEELKWMGVPDYLKAMENAGQTISWGDLNEYMENNRVQLKREVRAETDADTRREEDRQPTEITWENPANYFDDDKPAWSEQVNAEIPSFVDEMRETIEELQSHYEEGGTDRDMPETIYTNTGLFEDLMSRSGWALSDVQGLGWKTDQDLDDKAEELARHMVEYNYEQDPFYRVRGHIPTGETEGELYEIIGNDSGMWRVQKPDGTFMWETGRYSNRQEQRAFDNLEEAQQAALEHAFDEGLLTEEYDEDEEQTTIAGPGSNYEQYNFFGLEGAEPDSYQEVILGYNRWGPTFGGNYPQGGYAGIPDETTSKYRPVDRGITLYSEPHFGTRNAFLHMRMHDRYLPSDGRGNVAFMPMGKSRDESGGYSPAKWYEGKIEFPPWQEEGSTDFADILKARLIDSGLDDYITLRASHRETGWTQDFTMEAVDYDAQRRIQNIIESINTNQSRGEGGITAEWKPHKASPEMTHGPGWSTGHNVVDLLDEDGSYWSRLSDGFEPVKARVLDELQSTWNTQGRDKGFSHPTKYVVFNTQTGDELGWYDTKEEMTEAHPIFGDNPNAGWGLDPDEVAERLTEKHGYEVKASDLIDFTPPLGATDTSKVGMHPLMNKGETYMAGFKDFIRAAKQDGIEYIIIPGGDEQAQRYNMSINSQRYQKMVGFYDQMLPRMINKFLKKVGSEELQQIGVGMGKDIRYGWLLKITPALEAAIMEGLDLYSKVIKPKAGLLGRREEGLLAYA